MRSAALAVLACPACGSPLVPTTPGPEIEQGELTCSREGIRFPVVEGIPELLVPTQAKAVKDWADRYARVWALDGWGSPDTDYLQALPERDTTGRRTSEWRVKSRSMEALCRTLDPARDKRVIDMGSGVGWLSHRLAERGHDVYAVDALTDSALGLGAAAVYLKSGRYFERIRATMERPPFHAGAVDVVVCNASLHYASDLEAVISALARVLRDEGRLVIMGSPVHSDERSARRAERNMREHLVSLGADVSVPSAYHHFTRTELLGRLTTLVGPTDEIPFEPGIGFRGLRWAKGVGLGMELARFPLLEARKRNPAP